MFGREYVAARNFYQRRTYIGTMPYIYAYIKLTICEYSYIIWYIMVKKSSKTTKVKKVKKLTPRQLQDKIWFHCKRLTRAHYPPVCYTCDRAIEGSNDHTAHFIPKSTCGAYLKYDLRNLRRCCYYCNINLGGNGSEYYRRLVAREGQAYVDTLFQDKNKIVKSTDHYIKILAEYEQMV